MNSKNDLVRSFIEAHPTEAARILERQREGDVLRLFEDLETETIASVVERMNDHAAADLMDRLETGPATRVMAAMPFRAMAILLRRMQSKEAVLDGLPDEVVSGFRLVDRFPDRTVGASMNPRALTATDDMKLGDVLSAARRYPDRVRDVFFVVDREGVLMGLSPMRQILAAPADASLPDVMEPVRHTLSPYVTLQDAGDAPGWRYSSELPVADGEGVLLGTIGLVDIRRQGNRDSEYDHASEKALGELFRLGFSAFAGGLHLEADGDPEIEGGQDEGHEDEGNAKKESGHE
ncbi:MAG: magnesium transporter [Gemmatimonadetes bacterium]|nr:magnesium transporter [Gemmatimonadota bacterium]MYG84065.1 magnesium transporter [Gemmatimonadota bacterium]MYJ89477.1 magnesium transporter [Gemmatimonadota bacterium]